MTDDMFYMILNSKQLSDLITSNLCSKEHVSHGFSTMLNFYTEFIAKKIKLARNKILQTPCDNCIDYNQLVSSVFDKDLDMQKLKLSFIRKETHPGNVIRKRESTYKKLGDNYIDHLDVRFESYGLASTVYIDVKNNPHQHRGIDELKTTFVAKAIEINDPSASQRNKWSNYELNNLAVLANHTSGMGSRDFKKYFSF